MTSRLEFVAFLNRLTQSYDEDGANWENPDLARFLYALSRFAEDMDGSFAFIEQKLDVENPSWSLLAQMLLAARVYE